MSRPTNVSVSTPLPRQSGFTLVEAVVVIVITGIVAAIVAVFIARPIQGYTDAARRADLTDAADTALRRIARDLRLALPNSVRVNGANNIVEFLSTCAGGRYRAAPDGGTDDLDFNNANDTTFDVLGNVDFTQCLPAPGQTNQIVVYNLGFDQADAYAGNNRRAYSGGGGQPTNITFTSSTPPAPFPLESPGRRFHVVDTPVSYACAGGQLQRYWGYAIQANQPALTWLATPANNALSALLAQDVTNCVFTYAPGVTGRSGMVAMQITLSRNNETVTLYHQVHVTNVP